jgi:hypothetical protein
MTEIWLRGSMDESGKDGFIKEYEETLASNRHIHYLNFIYKT